MVITDIKTQSEILSSMVKELTDDMPKDAKNEFTRKHFDSVITDKFNKNRFPKMKIEITTQ